MRSGNTSLAWGIPQGGLLAKDIVGTTRLMLYSAHAVCGKLLMHTPHAVRGEYSRVDAEFPHMAYEGCRKLFFTHQISFILTVF
jgi:hypothetical protein